MTLDAVTIARASAPSQGYAARGPIAPSDDWRCDLPAERAVLGAILHDIAYGASEAWGVASAIVQASDFYEPRHRIVWEVFEALDERGVPLDAHAIAAELRARNVQNTVPLYLISDLRDEVVGAAWVDVHARLVAERAARRAAVEAAEAFIASATRSAPLGPAIAETLAALESVPLPVVAPPTLAAAVERQAESYEGRRPAVAMVPTGHAAIDAKLGGGLAPGHYLILGHPGTGKTTLGLEWALHIAATLGPVYGWMGEQTVAEVTTIATATLARVPFPVAQDPAKARATQDQMDRLYAAMAVIHKLPLHIVDETTPGRPRTVAEIVAAVRGLNATAKAAGTPRVAMVLIDNLLELEPRKRHASEWEGVVANMNDLRRARKLLNIPILTIAHPNADSTKGALYRRLRSGDVAGGKAAARKADGILCLHREDKHPTCDHEKRPPTPGLMQVYADKWRGVSGGTFYCELMELRSEHRFVSVGATDATPEVIDPRASMTRVRAPGPVTAGDDVLDRYGAGDGLPDVGGAPVYAGESGYLDLGPQDEAGAA